jgi:pyruvate dehydrogenase E1 component alpha subunit
MRSQQKAPEQVGREPDLIALYRTMLRIRRFEERCAELYCAERIRGFVHLYIGEEAVATGVLDQVLPEEAVVTTYRDHGHALARGVPMDGVMAEMHGRVEGVCRGRGGSMHLFHAPTRLYGGNAIVGGGLPLAVGLALADRMLGRSMATVCFFGEGAMAEGDFHESMNLAALWRLPVLFVCENNGYAMGTALERSQSETNLALKAAAYEIPAWSCDGMVVESVWASAGGALAMIREGGGPVFLEARTYRFRAHSMYDSDRYRDKAEIERWKLRDPIVLLADRLLVDRVGVEELAGIEDEVVQEVDRAVAFADAGHDEPVSELSRFVMSQAPAGIGSVR